MSLRQLFAIIRAAWMSIAAMVVVASIVAFAFGSSLNKEYSAKARVMLNIGNSDPNQFSALAQKTEGTYLATQIRLVGDERVLRTVVTKLGWPTDPSVIAQWQAETGGQGDVTAWAARRLAPAVAARQFGDSSIIEIFYTAQSVEVAKAVVGLIREAFIDNDLQLRVEAARKASAWNRTVAAQALVALQRVEAERSAFLKANQIPIDSSTGNLEMRELSTARAAAIPSTPTSVAPGTTVLMGKLKAQLDSLDAQIAILGQERGSNDPVTQNLTALRDNVRVQLERETAFARAGTGATDAQIVANRAARDRQYLEARLRVLDRAPLFDRLAAIDRELDLRTRLYTNAAQRVQDFDTVAAAPSGLTVIGDIIANDDMIFPNVPLMVALAAGLSLALGIAMALIGEMMRRMVRGSDDLEFYSGVPVMAVIADAPQRRKLLGRFGRIRNLWPRPRAAVAGA